MINRLILASCLVMGWSELGYGFQLYTDPNDSFSKVAENRRQFRVYVSSTYFDFQMGAERPINSLHLKIVTDSLKRFANIAEVDDLSFTFAGTFTAKGMRAKTEASKSSGAYESALFYDLSGGEYSGIRSEAAGRAHPLFNGNEDEVVGGYITLNTKAFDVLHPDVNMASAIMHETMHVFGLNHSSSPTARMSYMDPHWFGLGVDDLLGLKQIFGAPTQTDLTVTTVMSGSIAKGVEVALINPVSGRSYVVISGYDGVARVKHIPPGEYWIVGREITPTGPCFTDPTTGFYSSFYVDDSTAVNNPEAAQSVQILENTPLRLTLNLLPGTKRFDCYFGNVMAARWWDNRPVIQALDESVIPGAYFLSGVHRDKDEPESNTSRDETSYPAMNFYTLGSANPIHLSDHTYDTALNFGDELFNQATVRVDSTAEEGVYAAYCEADGEYAVMHSFYEVKKNIESEPGIADLYPEFSSLMTPTDAKSSIHMEGERISESRKVNSPKTIGPLACGIIRGSGAKTSGLALLLLFMPLFTVSLYSKRKRSS